MKYSLFILLFLSPLSLWSQTPKSILALGDSLTEGYGISKEQAYPARLEALLKKKNKDIQVINAGISGSTSASGESRLKWQLKSKPDILLLALGANDGLRGLPTNAMETNLEKTILLAQQNKIKVVLAGMKIPMNYGANYRNAYEKVFENLAKKHKVILVPFLLDGVATIPELNIADGIHPNSQGHEKIALTVLPYIEKALKGL